MVDNLFFLFLDEIYSPNLNEFLKSDKDKIFQQENHKHFGLSGIILAASSLGSLNFKSRRIKDKFYPKNKEIIFHYVDILHNRDAFSDLRLSSNRDRSFKDSVSDFVKDIDYKYTYVFIDKNELIKKYAVFDKQGKIIKINKIGSNLFPKSSVVDYNLYLLCLKKMLGIFFEFITDRKIKARGIIVAEARGEREDCELREAFHKINCYGISKIGPKELRSIVLDLFIVPKSLNYIGTQIADLVLYPTYDAIIPFHNTRSDHFISFDKDLKNKLLDDNSNVIP